MRPQSVGSRMIGVLLQVITRCAVGLLMIGLAGLCLAQDNSSLKPSSDTPKTAASKTQAKSRWTAQQRHGFEVLKAAESEAVALQPEMRVFVIWQASVGYQKIDPDKSAALLRSAFQTSIVLETRHTMMRRCIDEVCNVKKYLQEHILRDLIARPHKPGEIESLLASGDPVVRQELVPELIRSYVKHKDINRAREALNLADIDRPYPYAEAIEVMEALPQNSIERASIFSQALTNFSNQHGSDSPQVNDLASMVFRFCHELPPASVLDAIDQILERAKDSDDEKRNYRSSLTTAKEALYFNSQYELRLFELLPVLEELDRPRAEMLLRENNSLQDVLNRYPQGMASLEPTSNRTTPRPEDEISSIYRIGEFDTSNAYETDLYRNLPAQAWMNDLAFKIIREMDSSPAQAISDAMTLPVRDAHRKDASPRAETLAELALMLAKKDPNLSMAALTEVRQLSDGLSLYRQADLLFRLPDTHLALKDEKHARSALSELLAMADKLYWRDIDPDDPNQAFKATWPSTALWRHCVEFSAKLSPSPAEDILASIPDPDIRTFEKVALATSFLGAEWNFVSRVAIFKNERHFEID